MAYPTELIPRPAYRYIRDVASLYGRSLLRSSAQSPLEFWDPVTGRPSSAEAIENDIKHIKDHSTSLLGTFTPEHLSLRITSPDRARRAYLVLEHWLEGEAVEPPIQDGEWQQVDTGTVYHYDLLLVNCKPFTYSFGDKEFSAELRVLHTPCRSNFWHFSVRVHDETGVDIGLRYEENRNRRVTQRHKVILTFARQKLAQFAEQELPSDYTPIPEALYTAT